MRHFIHTPVSTHQTVNILEMKNVRDSISVQIKKNKEYIDFQPLQNIETQIEKLVKCMRQVKNRESREIPL